MKYFYLWFVWFYINMFCLSVLIGLIVFIESMPLLILKNLETIWYVFLTSLVSCMLIGMYHNYKRI